MTNIESKDNRRVKQCGQFVLHQSKPIEVELRIDSGNLIQAYRGDLTKRMVFKVVCQRSLKTLDEFWWLIFVVQVVITQWK